MAGKYVFRFPEQLPCGAENLAPVTLVSSLLGLRCDFHGFHRILWRCCLLVDLVGKRRLDSVLLSLFHTLNKSDAGFFTACGC